MWSVLRREKLTDRQTTRTIGKIYRATLAFIILVLELFELSGLIKFSKSMMLNASFRVKTIPGFNGSSLYADNLFLFIYVQVFIFTQI